MGLPKKFLSVSKKRACLNPVNPKISEPNRAGLGRMRRSKRPQLTIFQLYFSKPQTLDEANAMFAVVKAFEAGCLKHLKILDDAAQASLKMTTHKEADDEVAALRERYVKVKAVSDEWMAKCDTL